MDGEKMKIEVIVIILVVAIIAFIIFYIIGKYNSLKLYENKIISKWNDVNKLIQEKIEILSKLITYFREKIKEEEGIKECFDDLHIPADVTAWR